MKRLFLALAALVLVAGCTRNTQFNPPEEMAQFAYQNTGPTSITLYTIVNRRTGSGAHTALQVNASERVLFDPAGSYRAEGVQRSGDVLYGYSPTLEQSYTSTHARTSHLVRKVTVPVSPEVAEAALRQVKANGPVGAAHCAQSTSSILRTLPGMQSVEQTYYPKQLEASFRVLPGASSTTVIEDD